METTEQFSEVGLSYGRCSLNPEFFDFFYDEFIGSSTLIAEKFKNTDMTKQKGLLKNGISYVIMFSQGKELGDRKMEKLSKSHDHSHLDIQSWMYDNWKTALMKSVKKFDDKITPNVLEQWSNVLDAAINKMVGAY